MGRLGSFWNRYDIASSDGTTFPIQPVVPGESHVTIDDLDVEFQPIGTGNWFDNFYTKYDSATRLHGTCRYHLAQRGVAWLPGNPGFKTKTGTGDSLFCIQTGQNPNDNVFINNTGVNANLLKNGPALEYYGTGANTLGQLTFLAGGIKGAPTAATAGVNVALGSIPIVYDGTKNRVGSFILTQSPTITNNTSVASDLLFFTGTVTGDASGVTPFTGANQNMILKASGNLGIGTTSPSSLLSVGASSQFQVNSSGNIVKWNNVAVSLPTSQGAAATRLQNDGSGNLSWVAGLSYPHTIFTPTTGSTVSLVNYQYNIINPAGALVALTVNLPSSPANNDVVYIKFTQTISTVTYANGTVVDGITAPTAGGLTILTFDSGTSSWY
jgi:hypothetical protein